MGAKIGKSWKMEDGCRKKALQSFGSCVLKAKTQIICPKNSKALRLAK